MKQNVLAYLHFMFNYICESEVRKAFANAPCDWEYIWQKYTTIVQNHGRCAANALFFCEIDGTLQEMLCDYIQANYPTLGT